MSTFIGSIGSLIGGAILATVAIIGLVNASTTDGANPANVNKPVIDYGKANPPANEKAVEKANENSRIKR